MPDKHSHNNKSAISDALIRKYLAGELDDKAMHALERQALDDPFLAGALEGYAAHEPDQSAHLADLQGRLEQRVAGEKTKVRPLYYRWAAAAAILLLLGLSFIWINRQQISQRDIAKIETTQPPAASHTQPDSAAGRQQPAATGVTQPAETIAGKTVLSPVTAPPATTAKKALRKAGEPSGYAPETTLQEDKADAPELAAAEKIKEKTAPLTVQDSLKKEGYNVVVSNAPVSLSEVVVTGYGVQRKQSVTGAVVMVKPPSNTRFLTGKVVNKESGVPLSGVVVNAGGDVNRATLTDAEGNFTILVDSTKTAALKLSTIGFNSQEQPLKGQENNITVAMQPSNQSLSEVVMLQGRVAGVEVARNSRKAAKAYLRQHALKIVILGSSTAEGVGPKTADSTWVSLLRKYIQGKNRYATVTNLAVGGYNSYRILADKADVPFGRPRPDPQHNISKALALQPDVIIINMPSNDITTGFSLEEFQRNLAAVVNIAREHNITCYITTTQPRNTAADKRKMLQQMRDLIIRTYPQTYINCWEGISSQDGNILPQYDSGDGVHLNGLGHRLMFERVKEKID